MKNYIIKTHTTMKEHNTTKYWVDSKIISDFYNTCEDLKTLLENYKKYVIEQCYIDISNNAFKNKKPMYIDTPDGTVIQTGYVITASMYFEESYYKSTKQYIELWLEINEIIKPNFESEVYYHV